VYLGGRDKPGHDERLGDWDVNAVYMMASGQHGTLYIGVTSELVQRVAQHREGHIEGITKRYSVKRLVWFEVHDNIVTAIQREKSLKKYKREWKVNLIERENPKWADLFPQFFVVEGPLSHLQPREEAM
jgi:putative endonuclease